MVSTHEIDLSALDFENLRNNDYIIMQLNEIKENDYILFRQLETGLFMMTQVKGILQNDGLKEDYALLLLQKYN